MPYALVTGASSGIGLAVSRMLLREGYEVFGIGRDFSVVTDLPENARFHPLVCDIRDTKKLLQLTGAIDVPLSALIHSAGCAYYGMHEELSLDKITEMVDVNIRAPMVLTQHLLRTLKAQKGTLIFISSVTAIFPSPRGAAYGATKAALSAFAESLFAENRKYGLRVVTIQPDLTDTALYRNADFVPGSDMLAHLTPEAVAESVRFALTQPEGTVIRDITLRPQVNQIEKKSHP